MNIPILKQLTAAHAIFNGHRNRNWTIILSSYQTLTQRHGPSVQSVWHFKEKLLCADEIKDKYCILDSSWPKSLRGLFRFTILDEAHQLRNLSSLQATTVSWVDAEFNLLLSATPLFNCVEDFKGLIPLVLPLQNNSLWQEFGVEIDSDELDSDELNSDKLKLNPFHLPDSDPRAVLCLTHRAMNKFVWGDSIARIARQLPWSEMVRRLNRTALILIIESILPVS